MREVATSIRLQSHQLRDADALAKRLRMSRSQLVFHLVQNYAQADERVRREIRHSVASEMAAAGFALDELETQPLSQWQRTRVETARRMLREIVKKLSPKLTNGDVAAPPTA